MFCSFGLHFITLVTELLLLMFQVKHDAEIDMSSTDQFIRSDAVSEPLTVSATAEHSNYQTGIKVRKMITNLQLKQIMKA